MRRAAILLILILLCLAWARAGSARSAAVVTVDSGTRLRVTGCLPACDTQLKGELLWQDSDSLALAGKDYVATMALRDVRRLEVGTPYRFNGRKALMWGGGTALAGVLLGISDESATAGEVIGVAAMWGFGAAVFAGGGNKALRAGGVGALVTAPIMGMLFVAAYEPCSGEWLCFAESEGALFAWGAMAGAVTGFIVGGAIGAFTGGENWEEIPGSGVSLSVVPTRHGLALGAYVAF
jgi:hypothetical protein